MSSPVLDIGPPRDPAEAEAFADLLTQSLNFPPRTTVDWLARTPTGEWTLARAGGRVVGGVGVSRVGQWIAGRRVPCAAVWGVGVAPEWRRQGVASAALHAALIEARAAGCAITSLYGSTHGVYRRAGYEASGVSWVYAMPVTSLPRRAPPPDVVVRPMNVADEPACRAVYAAAATARSGPLDRDARLWRRILDPLTGPVYRVVVERHGEIRGWAVWRQPPSEAPYYHLGIVDADWLDGGALDALLALWRSHASFAKELRWSGGVRNPIVDAVDWQEWRVVHDDVFMLRPLDVPAALAARGWRAGWRGEVHLRLRDPWFPANDGPWVVVVRDGRATVTPGGRGDLALDIRAFGPLFTGHATSEALVAWGLLTGPAAALATATAAFAGPGAWMREIF